MTVVFKNELLPQATAIDLWFGHVLGLREGDGIATCLEEEVPPFLSWIVRGGCAVQCQHCIFPHEGSKAFKSEMSADVLLEVLRQLSGSKHLIHEGRQLLAWQVPLISTALQMGHGVSLINNGQYATPKMLALCEEEGLAIDTLDVSVDGPEEVHNAQRGSPVARKIAMRGIKNAKRILKPGGKLTSLFTLTSLNYAHVLETGKQMTQMVDEWHISTMSLRPGIEHLRADKKRLASAFEQLLRGDFSKPTFLRSYSLDDFVALLEILGKETARKALSSALVSYNAIVLDVGIPLYFYPKSLQINETLVVDADQWWRMPFCIQYSLEELIAGTDAAGNNISHFSIAAATLGMDVRSLHRQAAQNWWASIGQRCLSEEREKLRMFL